MNKPRRLNSIETEEYRRSLRRLQEMGVQVGSAADFVNEPPWMKLEQVDTELATLYEYPGRSVAVRLFAKLTVIRPGNIIPNVEIAAPWGDALLSLTDAECKPFYEDLLQDLPTDPPNVLNDLLTHHVPLRPRQEEGIILAHGWTAVPVALDDHSPLRINLWLRDQHGVEMSFDFQARLDRTPRVRYERKKLKRAASAPPRQPIFPPKNRISTDREELLTHGFPQEASSGKVGTPRLPEEEPK